MYMCMHMCTWVCVHGSVSMYVQCECMCMCVCMCVFACVHECMFAREWKCMCICMCVCMCVYVCMHVCTWMWVCLCLWVYVHVYVHVCEYICVHSLNVEFTSWTTPAGQWAPRIACSSWWCWSHRCAALFSVHHMNAQGCNSGPHVFTDSTFSYSASPNSRLFVFFCFAFLFFRMNKGY